MTSILGISAFYHDSAAALIIDGLTELNCYYFKCFLDEVFESDTSFANTSKKYVNKL